jgi:cell division protein FtsB
MKMIVSLLVILLLALQYKLWIGPGSLAEVWRTHQSIQAQTRENISLMERNRALDAEVSDLKQGRDAIEERARSELGMIGRDEVFYQIIDE